MKNLSLLILFLLVSKMSAQTQIITICSEKNGCEMAKVNLTKSQTDNILEKPNFLVREKGEVILNMVECVSTIEKNTTPQKLHEKFGGKGTIKQISNFDLKKYLFEKACGSRCNYPAKPNAGQQVNVKIGLNGEYTFNKKFTFKIEHPEANYSSNFYLNTQNGYSLLDNDAMKLFTGIESEGEVNQILTSTFDFHQYMSSSDGKYALKIGGKSDNKNAQSQAVAADFFKIFQKTGNKKMIAGKFESMEYTGMSDGTKMSVWLSCADGISLDKKNTFTLTGFYGLGYIVNPWGETYLITEIAGDGMKIQLLNIENLTKTFSGKTYKLMGDVMAEALAANKSEIAEMENAENPYAAAIGKELIKSTSAFATTSDLQDFPTNEMASSEDYNSAYYDYLIAGLQKSIEDRQLSIKELDKNTTNYKKKIAELTCLKSCAMKEKQRFEKLKAQHLNLLVQYKNDTDTRNEKVSELMQSQGIPTACNCS